MRAGRPPAVLLAIVIVAAVRVVACSASVSRSHTIRSTKRFTHREAVVGSVVKGLQGQLQFAHGVIPGAHHAAAAVAKPGKPVSQQGVTRRDYWMYYALHLSARVSSCMHVQQLHCPCAAAPYRCAGTRLVP